MSYLPDNIVPYRCRRTYLISVNVFIYQGESVIGKYFETLKHTSKVYSHGEFWYQRGQGTYHTNEYYVVRFNNETCKQRGNSRI